MILTLLAIAIAPGLAIVTYTYYKDKYEKEPIRLLAKAFGFGLFSIILTLLFTWFAELFFTPNQSNPIGLVVYAWIMVALIEEGSKFFIIQYFFYANTEFNEPFDGIVYSVMVGMGFATFENILYVFEGGISIGLLRMFTSVPAHATFAIMMGYYIGQAKFQQKSPFYGALGLFVATLFHGLYDYCLFAKNIPGIWLGAFASLILSIVLSQKAIKTQVEKSPFKPGGIEDEV